MKNKNTFKFLLAAALIGGFFAASGMEEQFKRLKIDSDQEKLGKQLIKAAKKNKLDKLNRLIEAGVDVNHQDEDGLTALMWAAESGYLECVRTLLHAKADPNISCEEWQTTALMWAAEKGFHKIVNLLINAKAKPDIQDENGKTALMYAASNPYDNSKCIRLLIAANAHINALDEDGLDALSYAFLRDNEKTVNILIDAGADLRPTVQNFRIWSPKRLILRSINLFHQQKNKARAFLWCMKELTRNNGFNTDFSPFIAEPLFALPLGHKQMLEESIEMLKNKHGKIELRAALADRSNNGDQYEK